MIMSHYLRALRVGLMQALVAGSIYSLTGSDASALERTWRDIDTSAYQLNEQSIRQVSQAYGYVLAQGASIEAASAQFPDLARSMTTLGQRFTLLHGFPEARAEAALRAYFGDHYGRFHAEYIAPLVEGFANTSYDRDDIVAFNAEMAKRVDRVMDEDVLRTLLWLRYAGRSVDEFRDQWTQTYSSAGEAKALGLDLRLKLPTSWRGQPGQRPHVLTLWRDQNGTGQRTLGLVIRDISELRDISDAESREMLEEETAYMAPDNARDIETQIVQIEGMPFAVLDYLAPFSRSGVEGTIAARNFISVFQGRMITIQCIQTEIANTVSTLSMQDTKDTCTLIANSLVIMDRWR